MAKAVEDTTYYRYHRLISLNEVGAGPEHFGTGLPEWHLHNVERQKRRPFGMLSTSTHDTKRAEDVRARINAISEMPEEWKRRVTQWTRLTRKARTEVDGEFFPCRNDEYLLYQTLVGTWPFQPPKGEALTEYVSRIQQYMTKAIREGKQFSSWIAPNEPYETALNRFIETILADDPKNGFRVDLEEFTRGAAMRGMWNSLGQNLLKLTSPGIPDLYQGTEFWDLSLVDPDNRRPVDYEARRRALAELKDRLQGGKSEAFAKELVEQAADGRIKLAVQHLALEMRRRVPDLFTTGDYLPLAVEGALSECVCAFARRSEDESCVVIVPRLMGRLPSQEVSPPIGAESWPETSVVLPPELTGVSWKNVFTRERVEADHGGRLPVGVLLSTFPVGLFEAAVQEST